MKKLGHFLDRHLGYILIIPAIMFILLFSVLPIAESLRYSFFDFQLNDQQKSGLYFDDHYNRELKDETVSYIDYYLAIERDTVEKEETKTTISDVQASLPALYSELDSILGNRTGTFAISEDEKTSLISVSEEIKALVMTVYQGSDNFYAKEDMGEILSELDTSFIAPNFAGAANFEKALDDPRVRYSFVITIIFTVFSVFFELCLGLVLALVMNRAMRGRGLVRTFSLIPWAIPTSVAALIWAYLFNGSAGIVAAFAAKIGLIANSTDLLLTGNSALASIIMADVWKTTPYMALLLLAGLQVIPKSLYEASSLDGASKLQQFKFVTLPMLKPAILVALLFRTLDAFRIFDLIYVLTGGGPGGKTESVSLYAYKVMFSQTRFGYGSAIVIIMALAVGVISYLYIKFLDVQLVSEQ